MTGRCESVDGYHPTGRRIKELRERCWLSLSLRREQTEIQSLPDGILLHVTTC